ncbi:Protein of unknown function (DUF2937) [Roseibium hamelinense]|uniref:DUF2937 family protein n=2 Tax=Roseibium hamelinense TaxID=150831 RepID=A0A562SME3_9HYPH|nr:DUF2937 family protein [Roseibium hamelinense]TWI82333.1 Protein of unknown function (DUF2937) [Roseibium hamelinense]
MRVFVLLVMLACGSVTSRLPEFAQQYRQRLGGAIDALEQVMGDFQRDAAGFGLSVQAAILRLKDNEDPFLQARGNSMSTTAARLVRLLKSQQQVLQSSGSFERLVIIITGLDQELAQATVSDFEPAVPVKIEGAVSAAAGAGIGYFVLRVFFGLVRIRRRSAPN